MNNNLILINQIFPTSGSNTYVKNILLVLLGSLLLAISSKVQVPFWPVPMTMQTFAVFLIGMTYGWKLSLFTLLAYIVEGLLCLVLTFPYYYSPFAPLPSFGLLS